MVKLQAILLIFAIFATLLSTIYCADCELDGHQFNTGEVYLPIGNCNEVTCRGPNNQFMIHGCGLLAEQPGCRVVLEDLTKPYPLCCARNECD